MRHLLLKLLLIFTLIDGAVAPVWAIEDRLTVENTMLRAEYDLARKGQVYLYLNMSKKEFEVRSSGMTIATIAITEIRPWGPIPSPGLHLIVDKDRVPEREKIQIPPPGGEENAPKPVTPPPPVDPAAPPVVKKFDVQATEVTDMPTSYSLSLEGGGLLAIKSFPEVKTWKEKMTRRFEKEIWEFSHALQTVKQHQKKKNYSELTLILTPQDAQRLYWALPVGSALLIPATQP